MDEFRQIVPVSALDQDNKVAFYKKTYTNLAFAILLFIVMEYLLLQVDFIVNLSIQLIQSWAWLLVLGGFMLASNYVERMAASSKDKNTHYLALFVYVFFEALIFVPLIYLAIQYSGALEKDILSQAAVMTLALFTGISAVVFLTKKDFSFLKSVITMGGFIAIGLILAAYIGGIHLGLWFCVAMVILAAGSILYQTSNMVHKYEEDQYVAASLGLFASLMLLFWYVLSMFMSE
ncbi:Bax inhibitor-1 family protein [uncultured Kordia sp.]|uniref:Bax inhibitor-1/YccA family protein n=1 Tax=uncultured Kordia sp. TaxID=507699 RepID=UPI00263675C8|nr:Bax inhibitor-1 family protein [uncultured Kordia sp.]